MVASTLYKKMTKTRYNISTYGVWKEKKGWSWNWSWIWSEMTIFYCSWRRLRRYGRFLKYRRFKIQNPPCSCLRFFDSSNLSGWVGYRGNSSCWIATVNWMQELVFRKYWRRCNNGTEYSGFPQTLYYDLKTSSSRNVKYVEIDIFSRYQMFSLDLSLTYEVLWSTDTSKSRRVAVSDTCRCPTLVWNSYDACRKNQTNVLKKIDSFLYFNTLWISVRHPHVQHTFVRVHTS